jgi:cysteine desulfurase / selenocysteine lyase
MQHTTVDPATTRREFFRLTGAAFAGVGAGYEALVGTKVHKMPGPPLNAATESWRVHFPALDQTIAGRPLVYLDSAATSLRPRQVIDAIAEFYSRNNANPGATLHTLARRANADFETARQTVADFINAGDPLEVVFTRGTTEAVNLVAAAWGVLNLRAGEEDEILIGIAEHASNMAPWQLAARATGARVRFFDIHDNGEPEMADFQRNLSSRTRIVAVSHVSNVLGMINPIAEMSALARAAGARVFVDAAQSVPHFPIDVQALGCDFLAFSGHKMLGPMGVGVLWARQDLLEAMAPYQSGSNMAHDIDVDSMHLSRGALRFGAGTPSVADAVGLAAAIQFIKSIGQKALWVHEQMLTRRFLERAGAIRGIRILGSLDPSRRVSVFAFDVQGIPPREVLSTLDRRGIAIRAGDLASLPLLKRLGLTTAARASCYLYTTMEEVDSLTSALEEMTRAVPE